MDDPREQIYDEQINPLMAQIIALCKEHNIPFLASFQLTSEDDPLMCTSYWFPDGTTERLKEAANAIYQNASVVCLTTITRKEA